MLMDNNTERPAESGELCTCGRQAIVVYIGGAFGPTGWCGIGDGGDRAGPCPFCGGPRHSDRCPDYRLRLDQAGPTRGVYVAYQVTHGHRPDGWWYAVEIPGRPREEHGPFIDEDNVITAKIARMEELEAGSVERPAYDQNEQDELAWCVECGQVCGHAGHRHAGGDHGTILCEQCGVTLDPIT
jgi:hypothetical protein